MAHTLMRPDLCRAAPKARQMARQANPMKTIVMPCLPCLPCTSVSRVHDIAGYFYRILIKTHYMYADNTRHTRQARHSFSNH